MHVVFGFFGFWLFPIRVESCFRNSTANSGLPMAQLSMFPSRLSSDYSHVSMSLTFHLPKSGCPSDALPSDAPYKSQQQTHFLALNKARKKLISLDNDAFNRVPKERILNLFALCFDFFFQFFWPGKFFKRLSISRFRLFRSSLAWISFQSADWICPS